MNPGPPEGLGTGDHLLTAAGPLAILASGLGAAVNRIRRAMFRNPFRRKRPAYDKLPQHWPILFVVANSGQYLTHFHLQKTVYLLKVEGHTPIGYKFSKDAYGPYDVEIKRDSLALATDGFLTMDWERAGYKFRILPKGTNQVCEIESTLGSDKAQALQRLVHKYCYMPIPKLERYIYEHYVGTGRQHTKVKAELLSRSDSLRATLEKFAPSRNQLLLAGAVDYCALSLERERLSDVVHQDQLRRATSAVLTEATGILDLVGGDSQAVEHISLETFEETFDYCKKIVQDLGVLPDMSGDDFDLSALVEPEAADVVGATH